MTKEEVFARLKKLKQQDDDASFASADGVLPATKRDVSDEMGRMDTFREFKRDKERKLTSDE